MKPRNLWYLFRQDLTITLRNALVWFMLATALLMIVVIRFVLPGDFELEQTVYFHDATQGRYLEAALVDSGADPGRLMPSEAALEQAVADERGAVGIIFTGSLQKPLVTLVTHGELSSAQLKLLQASLEKALKGTTTTIPMETLRPQASPVPRNLSAVPMLLTFEVLITGFMLVAVLMFQEKQEGSIRAYRISPGSVAGYIISKTLVFTALGTVYGITLVLFTLGVNVNWPLLLAATAMGAALYTLAGLAVATFFNNMSEWFVIGLGILVLNFLPMVSYTMPTFAPAFLTWIPSYPVVFGLAEIIFPTGSGASGLFIYLAIALTGSYLVCHLLVHAKLMREGQ